MPLVKVKNQQGGDAGEVTLNDDVFSAKLRQNGNVAEAVLAELARRRRGTASTKTRAEVRGGGRKPWQQKGTNRARHGSIRSPIWRGGGVTFGPRPRSYAYSPPKKFMANALSQALTVRLEEGKISVVDKLELAEPKTKEAAKILDDMKVEGKVLVAVDEPGDGLTKSFRNLRGVRVVRWDSFGIHDLLSHNNLLITAEAMKRLEQRILKTKAGRKSAKGEN